MIGCPRCRWNQHEVYNTRPKPQGIWRRRRCLACGARWSTLEVPLATFRDLQALHALAAWTKPLLRRKARHA